MRNSRVHKFVGLSGAVIGLAFFVCGTISLRAATFTWTNTTSGVASWNSSSKWLTGSPAPLGGAADTEIRFFADTTTALPNSTSLVTTNNLGSGSPASFQLNILTLNGLGPVSGNGVITIQGADLVFTNNAGTLPVVNLNGSNNTTTLSYQINSNVKLANNTTFQGLGTAPVTISGVISGSGSLSKTNTAVLTLTGANTYTGATIIQRAGSGYSVLEANDGTGLPTASNLQFDGGILQSVGSTPVTFTRSLGTAAGQVQWLSHGGFAANGAKLTVNIGGNPTPSTLVWNSANFLPNSRVLVFGSSTATAEVEFKNNLDLAGGNRVIQVTDNPDSGGDFATISGVITNGALEKQSGGTLKLTGVNKYTGTTALNGGVLQAVDGVGLPNASYLQIGGGRLESSGTFTRGLATSGAGKIGWGSTSAGGFSAAGGKLTVTFAGAPSSLVWGSTPGFLGSAVGSVLVLGSVTADSEVELTQNIDLNEATRTIQVVENLFTNTDVATLSGVISSASSAGAITLNGGGTLRLTGSNTFSGVVSIQQGVLEAQDGVGLPTAAILRLNSNAGINGVFQSTGTFTRSLGTSTGEVHWLAGQSAGFSAASSKFTVNIGGNVTPDTLVWGSTANFISTGQTLTFGSTTSRAELDFKNNIDLNNDIRTIQVNDNPTTSADFTTISGVISGTGNSTLVKIGTGKLVLAGNNTYSSGTTISAGSLFVNGTLSSGGGAVAVNSGGTLGGTGTISRAVTVATGGALAPGNSPGELTVASLSIQTGATYQWEIGLTTNDTVHVTGSGNSLTFGSGLKTLELTSLGRMVATNEVFTLFRFDGNAPSAATATNWTFLATSGGWNTQYAQVYLSGNQILLTGLEFVPEPSTLLLISCGGLLLWRIRRR